MNSYDISVLVISVLVISVVGLLLLFSSLARPSSAGRVKPRGKITVFLCSPYRGPDMMLNIDFARRIARELEFAGAVVFAPHLHTTTFLNDEIEAERNMGIESGLEIMSRFDEVWFVLPEWRDELSTGMKHEFDAARRMSKIVITCHKALHFDLHLAQFKRRVSDRRAMVAE